MSRQGDRLSASRIPLYPSEIAGWQPPEVLSVSAWADKHRILDPLTSAEPGPWRTARTPYLRGILDAFSDPAVEQITIIASTQVAKTEAQLNCLAYAIDQDPGPILFVMPREKDAVRFGQRRIRPMLESSPRLARHLSGWASDNKNAEIKLGQALLYLAWSNSPAALASNPIRYLFMDEIDKYPMFSGREADPISLATERQRTFFNRKRILASTPTNRDGYIWREWEVSDRQKYWVPCARCGEFQVLKFARVKWPEDVRDPNVIIGNRLAVYQCEVCEAELDDLDKTRMTAAGVWVPDGCKLDARGELVGKAPHNTNRGFHVSALYSPWLTYSDMAGKFLSAKDDAPRLLNFVNSWLGEPWEEKGDTISPEYIAARAGHLKRGIVPRDAIVVTAGIDVQDNHFYYVVRAWAPGETSWLVQAGIVESWDVLIQALMMGVFPIEGSDEKTKIRLMCIDSGHRTDEVYRVCREWVDIARPIKGQQQLSGGIPMKMSRVERNFAGRTTKAGIKLWHLDTTHFKDKLSRLIRIPIEQTGAWMVHEDPALDYLRQVTSEHKVMRLNKRTGQRSSIWTPKPGSGGNHWLDCEVYALAAAEMLGVWAYRPGVEKAETAEQPQQMDRPEPRTAPRGVTPDHRFELRAGDRRPKKRGGSSWATGGGGGRRGGWNK